MIKHVGRHNNQKVVVVFREIPGEEHMALVVYSDNIPSQVHDDIMSVLESPKGQSEHTFADALNRSILTDGRNALVALHDEKWLKKAAGSQIIIEASKDSHIRLDELNKLINEMESGDEAKARMAEVDAQAGLQARTSASDISPVADTSALSDEDLAKDLKRQASEMTAQAKTLTSEAKRLEKEAKDLTPKRTAKKTTKAGKASVQA
jgi:hypothetical protein